MVAPPGGQKQQQRGAAAKQAGARLSTDLLGIYRGRGSLVTVSGVLVSRRDLDPRGNMEGKRGGGGEQRGGLFVSERRVLFVGLSRYTAAVHD